MKAPRILHQLSVKINSSYLLAISYYVVVFTVLSTVMHVSGIFTHRESMLETITMSVGIGLMLGVLHRQVLYPKDLSTTKRLFLGTLIVLISATVIFIILNMLHI